MIYPEEIVLGLNRFYSGHFQNTLFETFLAMLNMWAARWSKTADDVTISWGKLASIFLD